MKLGQPDWPIIASNCCQARVQSDTGETPGDHGTDLSPSLSEHEIRHEDGRKLLAQ